MDRDAIQNLYKTLCPNDPVNVHPERIEQIKKDQNNFLFVCEEAGTILGTVFFAICLSPMYGFQPFGVVENFVVDEKYRGQGRFFEKNGFNGSDKKGFVKYLNRDK